jgi:hypothetical protein
MGREQKAPIMSVEEERFMAFEGLVQWAFAVVAQAKRLAAATSTMVGSAQSDFRLASAQARSEHHYFTIAAHKVLEHREWAARLGICSGIDFSMLDEFSRTDIRDLRNMREHVVEYFEGLGHAKSRWAIETPEFKADASSVNGTLIGGRLDWARFASAAEKLLPALLAEPIPFPRMVVPSSP